MALRALAGDESMELADWWTTFQEVTPETQQKMVDDLTSLDTPKPKRRRPKKKPTE